MATADQTRIVNDRQKPRLMELWWALQPLKSVVQFMQTGAHPDDEISDMLAALAFRDGVNISYACSTRGEGGQNDIGTEAGSALGVLRTKEMEAACDILGMRMYWHSTHSEDSITDFGFSKSGVETLGRWGRSRILHRFVEIVRTERPDILCPTFLDVPGQHGHHRAMTEAAHEVMTAAADPEMPSNLPPWQVKKLYLPAWSGAGQSYDDDLPPPPATLVIPGTDREAMTGWTWGRIGQQSRAYHRTQGMGRWTPPDMSRDWPLHLADSAVSGPDAYIWSGLARTLRDLAELPGAEPMANLLILADREIGSAIQAFPTFDRVASHALNADAALQDAQTAGPVALADDVQHKLSAKRIQLAHVVRLALGVEARAYVSDHFLSQGASTDLQVETFAGEADDVSTSVALPDRWHSATGSLTTDSDAVVADGYRAAYDPRKPTAPHITLTITKGAQDVQVPVPFDIEPVLLPTMRVAPAPSSLVINAATDRRDFDITLTGINPVDGNVDIDLPPGWQARRNGAGFALRAPVDVSPGTHRLPLSIGEEVAYTVHRIAYDHVAPCAHIQPAAVSVGVVNVALPKAKVAYIGAGNDRVGHWLGAIGVDLTDLSGADLSNGEVLDAYDSLVIGIFAMRFRPGLRQAMPAIHKWVERGGTLLTLYHRPWDNWDPNAIPPRFLKIGQPSLRWRVTDETAAVTHLTDHDVLSVPNAIGPADWDGWVKERGLYFAKSWDAAYAPLIALADPDEAPHNGALLVADIGKGRHVHTSLILHHQMDNLVPGAFRLMANLIAPRG